MSREVTDVQKLLNIMLPQVLAAAIVAALAYVCRAEQWPWYLWLALAPVLYLAWLLVFLALSALTCRLLGRAYPKPRYAVKGTGRELSAKETGGLITAAFCYGRLTLVDSLPLVRTLSQISGLQRLVLSAHSPAVRIGKGLANTGYLLDADLTEIGDNVVIGAEAMISAHIMSRRRNGDIVFISAPTTIGNGATIGGRALVHVGCQVGENASIEPGSVVYPFTRIGPGETWGGNPATLRQSRVEPGSPDREPAPMAAEDLMGF